jgi:hypothetical protein
VTAASRRLWNTTFVAAAAFDSIVEFHHRKVAWPRRWAGSISNLDAGSQRMESAMPEEDQVSLERERLALERERLRSDRQKAALEFRIRRRELSAQLAGPSRKDWRELLANPFTLAIVGGFVTLMTTIVTNHLSVSTNLEVEATKADLAAKGDIARAQLSAKAANQTLQADLIKKFAESPRTDTVRENLYFLVDAGLLPDYGDKIKAYLDTNPGAPQVGGTTGTGLPALTGQIAATNAVIASIASAHLSANVRAEVTELLVGGSLIEASSWFDTNVLNDPQYRLLRPLRFVDVPRSARSIDMDRDCPGGQCAIAGIERYRKILADKSEDEDARSRALRILIALVSDVHRPLHVAYGDDRGGNNVKVTLKSRSVTLHAVWDTMPVIRPSDDIESYARRLMSRIDAGQIAIIESSEPLQWAEENLRVTERIYSDLPSSRVLDDAYVAKSIPIVEMQIVRAGLRLAKLLNSSMN